MNSKSNSSYFFYNLFHFLHVCLSIGLAILVVYNQLANEARFIKLELEIERRMLTGQETTIQENRKSNENVEDEFIKYGGRITKRSTKLDLTNETFAGKSADNYSNTNLIICLNLFQNFLRNTKDSGRIAKLNACERLRGPPGKPGSPGPRGKIGRRGVRGPKGRPGDKGSIGKHGPPGPRGEKGFSGNVTVIGLKGDMGPKGTKGNKGNTGIKGQKGARGPKGDFGGPKGEKGERGPKGNAGQRGCPGDSFAPPSFITTPRALVFKEQDRAVLLCKAKANPFSHITWYRDGLKLLGHKGSSRGRYKIKEKVVKLRDVYKEALQCKVRSHPVTESSLIINTSISSDTGNYICEARNVMGVFRYQIRLLIQVYVQFTTIPSSVTVLENENVQLSCRASGVPSPVITWYRKDGGAMPKRFRIVQGDLHITSLTKEREGSYVCVASNVLGARKTEATITVNVFPVITFFREQLLTINESQTLTLPCNASGYPKPIISWTKSEESLPRGRSVFDSQTLKITSAQYEDGGEYVCTANNTVGIVSKRTRVIVQVGPKIRQKPRSVEYGYEGNNKTLHFDVFALPEANIIWKKLDNTKMNERFRQESGNLVIERVQFTDSGFYKGTATNILGKVEITTFLIVQEPVPPVISSSSLISKVSLKRGSTFSMTCTAVGIPRPRFIWKYGGKNVTNVFTNASIGGLTVEIVNIKRRQAGRYTCIAINDFGVARQHVDLEVVARPDNFFYASGTGRLGTIQTFFVRQTGRYLIRAGGARGGNHSYSYGYRPGTYHGGRGATMEGEFKLSMGTTLKIVVGQKGGNSVEVKGGRSTTKSAADLGLSVEDNAGTGGGGGTFVYTASNNLLIAAGGGGGASSGYNGVDGQAGTAGTASIGKASSQSRAGGTGGNPGQCNSASASFHGGVGAGWKGQGCPREGKQHGERGGSRDQGWQGGRAGGMNSGSNGGPAPGAVGGFGGGGGGSEDNGASGGGGGYSGGGSGTHTSQAGGGGGSFCGGIRCRGTTGGNFKDDGFLKILYLGP